MSVWTAIAPGLSPVEKEYASSKPRTMRDAGSASLGRSTGATSMPRRLATVALPLVLLLAGSASAQVRGEAVAGPAPAASALFLVSGHGWGHGVGMSQYGALGYAQHGYGYARILAHYYPGTALATAPLSRVRVLLVQGRAKLTIGSSVPFRVSAADGTSYAVPAGDVTLGPKLRVKVVDPASADPVVKALAGPIVFASGTQPLVLGRPYRGQIQ